SGMPAHMTMMGMDSDNTPFKIVTKSLANYLWGMPLMKKEKYPSVGVSAKMQGDTLLVSRILPETIAFENGIHRGDIITAVDGKTFPNIIEYKIYMNYKNWGEKISFDILRDGEKKNITFVIEQKEEDCDCADKD
ncbi:MAG: PDZ domain-containing protein, partial [Candidatus Marinimicrobia bacterium]|nr:PDZ domain-containing protein [Candidatus Neomarinimicrobiota bacterium]